MKAITLWQPFASLIAVGAKIHETRHWKTNYRGEILIHASKRDFDWETVEYVRERPAFREALRAKYGDRNGNVTIGALRPTLGCALCLADLVDCYPTGALPAAAIDHGISMEAIERDAPFGDFNDGRFAWLLRNVRPLPVPIPVKGAQGIWTVPADVEAMVRERVAA